jgi:hypothetical protein
MGRSGERLKTRGRSFPWPAPCCYDGLVADAAANTTTPAVATTATAVATTATAVAATTAAVIVALHLPLPAAVRAASWLGEAALREELLLAFGEGERLLTVAAGQGSIRHESTPFRITGCD